MHSGTRAARLPRLGTRHYRTRAVVSSAIRWVAVHSSILDVMRQLAASVTGRSQLVGLALEFRSSYGNFHVVAFRGELYQQYFDTMAEGDCVQDV